LTASVSSFALEYVIRKVQIDYEGLKLSGAHQILVFADGILLGETMQIVNKNIVAVLVLIWRF
jgi:hypothetical protein